ncbi:DUF6268 family outer membrane beta-barrel protein [Flavobacterium algicola]|uniref:DUF6268 family outer membrane beta-barrel protein n=1 Tax=Flavobacterium algicola TaxID=556529 RepID=UPI001EFE3415|nr:DUF6268 family outer membrane beta-barrel protein [Flavobacterium algicola]MCG9791484.1 DUF6268 family outer membrane beta-barrel protein [Flavobacterium algicola]
MAKKTFINLLFMLATSYISSQNSYIVDANVNTQSTSDFNNNESSIKIAINSNINKKTAITNNLAYEYDTFVYKQAEVNHFSEMNSLNRIAYNFEVEHAINAKTKFILNANPVAGFQSNLNISDVIILGGIAVNHTFNVKNNLTIGLQRNTYFGSTEITPTVSFHHQVNSSLSYDLGFPATKLNYSNNTRNLFRFTSFITGSSYSFDKATYINDLNSDSRIEFSTLSSAIEFERNVDSNWYLKLQAGYDVNTKFEALDKNKNTLSEFNNSQGYKLSLGIKYKL